jgi:hypothetical protein
VPEYALLFDYLFGYATVFSVPRPFQLSVSLGSTHFSVPKVQIGYFHRLKGLFQVGFDITSPHTPILGSKWGVYERL